MSEHRDVNGNYEQMIRSEAAYWDRNVDRGSSEYDFFGVWQDTVVNEVFYGEEINECYRQAHTPGGRILELGCGRGGDAVQLARYGATVDALDLSRESIKAARANYEEAKKRYPALGTINFIVGDFNKIAFGENSYDCVFAKSSLYLVWYLDDLMRELKKALKPQGKLVVFDEVGMHKLTSLIASILVFVLPTTRSYRDKLRLKSKGATVKKLLGSERPSGQEAERHHAYAWRSPFDSVSRSKLIAAVEQHFTVVDIKRFNLIMHYLLPRLKIPRFCKRRLCTLFHAMDTAVVNIAPRLGEYVRIVAVNGK